MTDGAIRVAPSDELRTVTGVVLPVGCYSGASLAFSERESPEYGSKKLPDAVRPIQWLPCDGEKVVNKVLVLTTAETVALFDLGEYTEGEIVDV